MKKRFSIPVIVIEILKKDSSHFNFSLDALLNSIILNFSHRINYETFQEFKDLDKEYFQFNINDNHLKYYKEQLRINNIQNESDFLRRILYYYVNLNPYVRERILFKEKVAYLNNSILNKTKIAFRINGRYEEREVLKFGYCSQDYYMKIFFKDAQYFISDIQII